MGVCISFGNCSNNKTGLSPPSVKLLTETPNIFARRVNVDDGISSPRSYRPNCLNDISAFLANFFPIADSDTTLSDEIRREVQAYPEEIQKLVADFLNEISKFIHRKCKTVAQDG
jgi:hypothetical protein